MKRQLLLIALLATSAAHAAPAEQAELRREMHAAREAFLDEPANRGALLRGDRDSGVPSLIRRGTEPLAKAPASDRFSRAETVKAFVRERARLFRLRDAGEELVLADVRHDARDASHYRFRQYFSGVPVRGAQLLAHFDANGELYAVNASTLPTPTVSAVPSLAEYEALAIARARFTAARVEQAAPELEFRRIDGEPRLVYAMHAYVNDVERWQTVVDAHSGEVLQHRRDVRESSRSASGLDLLGRSRSFRAWHEDGRYHLVDVALPVATGYEDPLSRRSEHGDTYVVDMLNSEGDYQEYVASAYPNGAWDAAGVSAITHVQAAYRYFQDAHGRAGIDNRNGNLLVGIHYGNNYDNAFWSGKWLVFGDGDDTFTNPAACADIVAHEYTHGVIEHTAGLLYENQSGALNESFADVFAALIDGNWTLAENCTRPAPGWLRNMENSSHALRWQPEHMEEYVERENTEKGDWGGVHINSGIPNHAAWLLMEGLDELGLGESISRASAGRLYYRALTTYLTESAQFIDLRRALLLAASDLYPDDARVAPAVRAAFDAVGIVESGSLGETVSGSLAIDATRLEFGDVTVGERRTLALRLTNTGEAPLLIHSTTIDDAAFSHSFANNVLFPGESIEGAVTFNPAVDGTTIAMLEILHDGAAEPAMVELAGNGVSLAAETPQEEKREPSPTTSSSGGGLFMWLLAMLALVRGRGRA